MPYDNDQFTEVTTRTWFGQNLGNWLIGIDENVVHAVMKRGYRPSILMVLLMTATLLQAGQPKGKRSTNYVPTLIAFTNSDESKA